MINDVVSVQLAVNESMVIKKQTLTPENGGNGKRICIVTGTHGDELEGQYVCYELIRRINENKQLLRGTVDIYPALNPLGIDSITRGIPMFDLDMNRIFPGAEDGAMAEYAASGIVKDILGADMCVDVHSSNIFLSEVPQVRISEDSSAELMEYAKMLNTDFVWVYSSATVLEATLAYSLNKRGVPTLVAEMGAGMRITPEYGKQVTDGLFNLMNNLGIWAGEVGNVKEPIVSTDGRVSFVNSSSCGVFLPEVKLFGNIEKDGVIGRIVSPLTGSVVETLHAPCRGKVFTVREYPIVYDGSLIARILEEV